VPRGIGERLERPISTTTAMGMFTYMHQRQSR
jgi:hypothetical protein